MKQINNTKQSLNEDLTVLILTMNEEKNLPYALENVVGWAHDVMVLDSGSQDQTQAITERYGAQFFYNRFETYAKQRNHALEKLPIQTDWVMFLDADEYLTQELKDEIKNTPSNAPFAGYEMKRRFHFMGRWIKHGGYYPSWLLRLFRHGKGKVMRDINEHVHVEGTIGQLKNDFVDHNRKGLKDWLLKHIRYAEFEAKQLLNPEKESKIKAKLFGSQSETKQWIRVNIWNAMLPPLIRPFIYYFFRYFVRFGFLDGRAGLVYHFLQGLWLQFLIDALYIQQKFENSLK